MLFRKLVLLVSGSIAAVGVLIVFLYCMALVCELKDRAGTRNAMEMGELDEQSRVLRERRREEQRQQQRQQHERARERERERERDEANTQRKKRASELEKLRDGPGGSASSSSDTV